MGIDFHSQQRIEPKVQQNWIPFSIHDFSSLAKPDVQQGDCTYQALAVI